MESTADELKLDFVRHVFSLAEDISTDAKNLSVRDRVFQIASSILMTIDGENSDRTLRLLCYPFAGSLAVDIGGNLHGLFCKLRTEQDAKSVTTDEPELLTADEVLTIVSENFESKSNRSRENHQRT